MDRALFIRFPLYSGWKSPGLGATTSRHHPGKVLEIHWLPFQKVLKMAGTGEISDTKSIIGLFRAVDYINRLNTT
ncbi:MAG: hypothetical protein BMS9Abin15_0100 [Gammaproteobacteria bacterium]|nr:MAG: hypothetical protein BMS9Abin15_0100 [Gammaproteobacteria bacterium]